MAQVHLLSALFPPGPILIEADPTMTELRGIQLSDALVVTVVNVCFSNFSGMTVSVDGGSLVGSAMTADSIPFPKSETNSVEQGPEENAHPSVRQTTLVPQLSDSERKQKVRELFSEKLLLLLQEYHDVFSLEDSERGETDVIAVHIDTGDTPPQAQPVCRIPLAVHQEVARQLQQMQEDGIIQPSNSPWVSPIVLVKKDGGLEIFVDYRALNLVTKADRFPLPRIADQLDRLGRSHFFTTLDLAAGF